MIKTEMARVFGLRAAAVAGINGELEGTVSPPKFRSRPRAFDACDRAKARAAPRFATNLELTIFAILAWAPPPRCCVPQASWASVTMASLSVRVEQPVQGCAMEPFLLLRGAEGDVRTPDEVEFQWFRSAKRRICCNPGCAGRKKFPHFKDATFQLYGLSLPEGMDLFCGTGCAHQFWKQSRVSSGGAAASKAAGGTSSSKTSSSKTGSSSSKTPGGSRLPVGSAASTDDWTFISRTKQYSPTAADVGHQLSVRCVSTDRTNACEKTVKTNTVLPQPGPPPPRVLTHARPNPRAKGLPLRVVSFNVLAEIYATKQQYPDCPMWALTWNYRKKNLLREIRQFDGDIISLQEVQADRFEDFFLPEMRKLGYEGLYKKKTRESMGREGKVDGCALFYRTSALKLLEKCVNRASCTSPFFPPSPCRLPERCAPPPPTRAFSSALLRARFSAVASAALGCWGVPAAHC